MIQSVYFERMPVDTDAAVIENRRLSSDYNVLSFDAPDLAATVRPGQFVTVPADTLHRTRPAGARSVNLTFERRGAETVFEE